VQRYGTDRGRNDTHATVSVLTIAMFGLGEAGSLLGADLAAAGAAVDGYDPADVATPPGVRRHAQPDGAVASADVVLSVTAAADAEVALSQAIGAIPAEAVYADLSTAPASLQARLGGLAAGHGLAFADVALMAPVPGRGIGTPALASGPGAGRLAAMLVPLGMPVTDIGGEPGLASSRKLLRSVMMKGLAAVVIEAMQGAEQAGCEHWLWGNLVGEITAADGDFLARLVRGTAPHALRRMHEMEASAELLAELGVDPVMTRSTVESLRRAVDTPLPNLPDPPHPVRQAGS